MKTLAAILWVLCGLALIDHLHGNPTAINGVVGAGGCALIVTTLAVIERA